MNLGRLGSGPALLLHTVVLAAVTADDELRVVKADYWPAVVPK